jgi:excinuclease ABC subunit A
MAMDVIAEADCTGGIGPEAGSEGSRVVAFGTPEEVAKSKESRTAGFLAGVLKGRTIAANYRRTQSLD